MTTPRPRGFTFRQIRVYISSMRATRLTATAAAAAFVVIPVVTSQASASAAPTQDHVSTSVGKDRSGQARELEVIRGKANDDELEIIRRSKRLRGFNLGTQNRRELEIIRGANTEDDELEITRVRPRP